MKILDVKDMIKSPLDTGYRAVHVRTVIDEVPCEIQIRTLAQDVWARLSHADLYGENTPPDILKIAKALSTQLHGLDEIAQEIRNKLNQCPSVADKIDDSDSVSPQRLALLYKNMFGEEIWEWTLMDWVQTLDEVEVEEIGEVRELLNDTQTKETLDREAMRIRKHPLENSEWAVFSALVATETSRAKGIRMVRKRIQNEWDEIVSFARHEALSGIPDTLGEFIEVLKSGHCPVDAISELGGIGQCFRCGADILIPDQAAEVVLEYYGNTDYDTTDLSIMFENAGVESLPAIESVDYSGACQYCGYQMSKDA